MEAKTSEVMESESLLAPINHKEAKILSHLESVKSRHQYFRFFLEKSCQYHNFRAGTSLK